MSIRVLIVDDQALMRLGFRTIVDDAEDMEVVGEASDGRTAITQTRALRPDVVLLDVRMPGMDGLEATRRLLEEDAQTKIIVLTTFDLDDYAYQALRAGARGFLLKDTPVADLLSGIRAVAAGHAVAAPRVTKLLLDRFGPLLPGGDDDPTAHETSTLTVREHEVLLLIARGLSNHEIAVELHIAEVTVKTHVAAVLSKMGLRNRIAAAIYAHEHGLLARRDPP